MPIAKGENIIWKYYIYVTFWKRQNYRDSKQISDYKEFGEQGRLKRWSMEDFFQDNKVIMCNTIAI